MIRARDVRRAVLRGLLLFAPPAAVAFALGPVDPALVATGAVASALLVPISLVELRAADRPGRDEPFEPFLAWVLAAGALLLVAIEHAYVSAALSTGSLERGMGEALEVLGGVWRGVLATAVGLLGLACPFALAAHVRLRGYEPRSTVFLATFLLLITGGCMTFGAAVLAAVVVVYVLLRVYALADWIDERLFSGPSRDERAAFEAEAAAISRDRLWLLAYLDHAPARHALGWRAPEPPRDLEPFVLGLEPAGREAAVRAAAVAAGLAAPFLGQDPAPRAILAALDAWLAAPSPERRDDARAQLAGWTPADEVAAGALRDAVAALDGEPPWATRSAIRSAARAARAAARLMDDAAAAREGLRAGLLAWALHGGRGRDGA